MAKAQAGLPEGFDINVSSSDLAGPARLPGYLDDDPVLELARLQKQAAKPAIPARAAEPKVEAPPPTPTPPRSETEPFSPIESVPSKPAPSLPAAYFPTAPQAAEAPRPPRRRLQINLNPEGERMVEELLDLVSNQSAESRIKVSEFVQALVLTLYNSRSEISLGTLPQRGRWGSPTAKAFPVALAQAFREAIVLHDKRIGGNQFKKAIGG